MIAAKHQRQRARIVRLQRHVVQAAADPRDLVDVLLRLIDGFLRFRNRRGQIAVIADRVSELGDPIAKTGDAERRRSHVHTAACAAKVERHADDVDGPHLTLYQTEIPSPDGETIDVKSPLWFCTVLRKGSISLFLFTTLWAVKSAPGVRRGNTMSKNFL